MNLYGNNFHIRTIIVIQVLLINTLVRLRFYVTRKNNFKYFVEKSDFDAISIIIMDTNISCYVNVRFTEFIPLDFQN